MVRKLPAERNGKLLLQTECKRKNVIVAANCRYSQIKYEFGWGGEVGGGGGGEEERKRLGRGVGGEIFEWTLQPVINELSFLFDFPHVRFAEQPVE